jgi:hypothetical protein
MKKFWLPVSAFCFLLCACAGPVTTSPQGNTAEVRHEAELQKELVFRKYVTEQDKLYNIAFPLMGANAEFCGTRTAANYGFSAWNTDTVERGYKTAAAHLYNLQKQLAVLSVADGSPADRAGVRSGDFILGVNGRELPEGLDGARLLFGQMHAGGYEPLNLVLEREGRRIKARVRPIRACDYPVIYDFKSAEVNALSDGRRIIVSNGILRMAENDNEVALVLAHELAHNALNHIGKQEQNAMTGMLGGLAIDAALAAAGINTNGEFSNAGGSIGAGAHNVAFEQEADYVGMYFMERAGYDSGGVADFWRRVSAESPDDIYTRTNHPTNAERFIAIERTHDEILAKKTRHQALRPNLKL